MPRLLQFGIVVSVLIGWFSGPAAERSCSQETIDFGRDIRPILSDKCFACHGPDAQKREGGFRLDLKSDAFGEADSGRLPIVPGKPEQSELVRRIMAHDEDQMPPATAEKQLKSAEIESLQRWVAEGAAWSEHWAFVCPDKPMPPIVHSSETVSNPIDRFVISRLESRGLTLSPAAAAETLIRRVTFDLTGLPPTPVEVDAFLADASNTSLTLAYEKLVDRLLQSPHYGEQMSVEWLDAARYADSNGYQNDFGRDMWPWRDWVIHSFNDNQPFDQFTLEQIAGDLLPGTTDSQVIATGFNRNHRSVTEGGSIEEEWRVENVVDRVETTATTFLGLTMGCARCHDHKYDPISQREFYQFYAYFNSIDEKGFHAEKRGNVPPLMMVHSEQHQQELADIDRRIDELEFHLKESDQALAKLKSAWKTGFSGQSDPNPALGDTAILSVATGDDGDTEVNSKQLVPSAIGNSLVLNRTDKPHLVVGNNPSFSDESAFSVSAWVYPKKDGAIISKMNESDDYRGFDMLINGDGRLEVHLIHQWPVNAIKVTTTSRIPSGKWTHVCLTYDGSRKAGGLSVFFNDHRVQQDINENSLTGSTLTEHPTWVGFRHATPRFVGRISRIHVFDAALTATEIKQLYSSPLRSIVAISPDKQNEEQKQLSDDAFRASFNADYFEKQNQLAGLKSRRIEIEKNTPTTMILKELDQPRETFVLNRGQYDQPDPAKQERPGIPAFLPQPNPELPRNRLGLARWLVDARNPLTARVAVNRFWQHYFGNGLVETPENFGVQSPAPLQQDLLDWLAVHFVESGWDVKALQKLIVMSSTYRQSSSATPETYESDPRNAWLSRGPRFRLSSEAIRDNALAAAGLLNRKIGGPSVKPYQPDGLWRELAGGASQGPYVQDKNENIYRRSLYIYRKRTVPPPTMTTFDAGSREVCQVARPRTNTPLQALALLNDTTYVEASRRLAENSMELSDNVDEQISFAFRRATARRPSDAELAVLRSSYEKFLRSFESSPESATQLLEVGESKVDLTRETVRLAAISIVCSMIFNLDETINKE